MADKRIYRIDFTRTGNQVTFWRDGARRWHNVTRSSGKRLIVTLGEPEDRPDLTVIQAA